MGLTLLWSPPDLAMADRMAARSTTAGTPVKSCISTRDGMNGNSRDDCDFGSQLATAITSSSVTR